MIKNILILSLLLAGQAAFAAEDCAKSLDACSAKTASQSPFVAASMRESVPPHVDKRVKKSTAPFLVPASSAAVAEAGPAEPGGKLSSPAWLLLVIAGFTGLYFYLRGGAKKRRGK